MSRLFKQIQQAQAQEQAQKFVEALKASPQQKRKFNPLPFFCIISLFAGIIVAYFYTDQDALPVKETEASLQSEKIDIASPIPEVPEVLAENVQDSFVKPFEVDDSTPERNFEDVPFEEAPEVAEAGTESDVEIKIHPMQWNLEPFRDWIQERLNNVLPKLRELKNSLNQFTYLDATQPIPEKEISLAEKERLELIQRFLKKFRVDAVRIDGSYSRIMANGQAYYVNTVVSQRPRLKLTGITSQEMIFKDEYNQEYKKEISQND